MSTKQKYTDVGMLIPGAPKLRAKAMVDEHDFSQLVSNIADSLGLLPEDADNVVYSVTDERNHHLLEEWQQGLNKDKLWPAPSYGALLEKGVPAQVLMFAKTLRDSLPRHAHRPVPKTLKAFSEMIGEARQFTQAYLDHWENAVAPLGDTPPSYSRIAQVAALAQDLSDWRTGQGGSRPTYPLGIATPLTKDVEEAVRDGFHNAPLHEVALNDIAQSIQDYRDADESLGTQYYVSGVSPARASLKAMRATARNFRYLRSTSRSCPLAASSRMRRVLIYAPSPKNDEQPSDRNIGYGVDFFKTLKIKPASLEPPLAPWEKPGGPAAGAKAEKKSKPRRPERLTAEEAKNLLKAPEDDGEDEQQYQDLNALIEMGMVRGIQWGEWVPQKERATLVKNIFESFQDFSTAMEITPSLAGLGDPVTDEQRDNISKDGLYDSDFTGNEALGLALGARGKSAAAAHYEPGLHTINLTRLKGAGALAHEMFHGLDYKLTQLLDLDDINRRHSSTDVRKTTASKHGITTFSELIAHHWWLKTHQSDRKVREVVSPSDFHKENEKIITESLKFSVRGDEKLREQVMPLMTGLADFVREMYHQPRQPEDMLKNEARKASFAMATKNESSQISAKQSASSGDHHLSNITLSLQRLVDVAKGGNPHASNHVSDLYNRFAISLSEVRRNANLYSTDEIDIDKSVEALKSFSCFIPSVAADGLEEKLKMNVDSEQKLSISSYLMSLTMSAGIQAIMYETAISAVRDFNSPPVPDSEAFNTPERDNIAKEQIRSAIEECFLKIPNKHLDVLRRHSGVSAAEESKFAKSIRNINPTSEGKLSGANPVNLNQDEAGRMWLNGVKEVVQHSQNSRLKSPFESIATLRPICDAQKNPPARLFGGFSSRFMESLGLSMESAKACLDSESSQSHEGLRQYMASSHNLPSDTSLREMIQPCLDNDQSAAKAVFSNLENKAFYKPLLSKIIETAYRESDKYDGNISTFINTMKNPAMLGEEMPQNLPMLFDMMAQHEPSLSHMKGADLNSSESMEKAASFLMADQNKTLFHPLDIKDVFEDEYGDNNSLNVSDIHALVAGRVNEAFSQSDATYVQKIENAINEYGSSFRYMDPEDKASLISGFYQGKDEIMPLLSGGNFLDTYTSSEAVTSRRGDTKSPEGIAKSIINASHVLSDNLHRENGGASELHRLRAAKINFRVISTSTRTVSNTLLNSAHYDELEVRSEPFIVNPKNKRGYWYSAKEMFARCSEAALSDTLAEQGIDSPYLVTVPSKDSQQADLQNDLGQKGTSPVLNYPAGAERENLAAIFQESVIPNMEAALDALSPNAKPAYEAYMEHEAAISGREAMVQRMDATPDERMVPQTSPDKDSHQAEVAPDQGSNLNEEPEQPSTEPDPHPTPEREEGDADATPSPDTHVAPGETPALF